jgi:hypothetical protein
MLSACALIGIGLVLLVTACGAKANEPTSAADASLRVKRVLDPKAEGVYVEGSVWHVRVFDSRGHQIVDRKLTNDSVSLLLAEGRYGLWSEELPCDGNCSRLDPGTDSCSIKFDVGVGEKLNAIVALNPSKGCTIAFHT